MCLIDSDEEFGSPSRKVRRVEESILSDSDTSLIDDGYDEASNIEDEEEASVDDGVFDVEDETSASDVGPQMTALGALINPIPSKASDHDSASEDERVAGALSDDDTDEVCLFRFRFSYFML